MLAIKAVMGFAKIILLNKPNAVFTPPNPFIAKAIAKAREPNIMTSGGSTTNNPATIKINFCV